jgi:hypothetical protein
MISHRVCRGWRCVLAGPFAPHRTGDPTRIPGDSRITRRGMRLGHDQRGDRSRARGGGSGGGLAPGHRRVSVVMRLDEGACRVGGLDCVPGAAPLLWHDAGGSPRLVSGVADGAKTWDRAVAGPIVSATRPQSRGVLLAISACCRSPALLHHPEEPPPNQAAAMRAWLIASRLQPSSSHRTLEPARHLMRQSLILVALTMLA